MGACMASPHRENRYRIRDGELILLLTKPPAVTLSVKIVW